jgi:membrane-bound serine protease (ClpP class)
MWRRILVMVLAFVGIVGVSQASAAIAEPSGPVRGVVLDSEINPVSAQFVTRRLKDAQSEHAAVFIIEMDTPGGLSTSMHDIVKAVEASTVPVVVWVGPPGSRAASAGAYIAAASDLLLMAPGTNIGSATPVTSTGQDLTNKIVNDAAAQIAALAAAHRRNADAFRSMVTKQANFAATDAVSDHVAEAMADDRAAVLEAADGATLDGRVVTLDRGDVRIATMPWYLRVLEILIDPNLIAILFGLGLAAIAIELFHPGAVVPGVTGAIFLLLSFLGLSIVPFNWAGLAFIVLAFILFGLEATVTGFGVLALGGVVSLVIGGLILFDTADGPGVSRPGLVVTAIVIGSAFTLLVRKTWKAHRAPQTTGADAMVGHVGEVRHAVSADDGSVFVNGELWAARTTGATVPIGAPVRIVQMHDLTLVVEPEPQESS